MKAIVAIYTDPDFFPPTINAILNLATEIEEVIVISRNNTVSDFPYPTNVSLVKIGKRVSVRESEKQSPFLKIYYFLRFALTLHNYSKRKGSRLLLIYDTYALLSFFLFKGVRHNIKVWYHSHDMVDRTHVSKTSISYFASKYEERAMRYIDFFSLPSKERLIFYPEFKFPDHLFIIPNYPSLKVYSDLKREKIGGDLNIIYQGFIGPGHSLEEFIELLQENVNGFKLRLILKGSVTREYQLYLRNLAEKFGVSNKITWKRIGPYSQLPALTASCHIGIGINTNSDRVSQTQGTSSNKIYEYVASGLPVILYESAQFTKYLRQYRWALFTDGSLSSIKKVLEDISQNLPALGTAARQDFETSLNFEKYFVPILKKIINE